MLCTYTGSDSRMYMDYRDATTGRGLEVSPGGVYDVEVASGQAAGLPLPPGDGRWIPGVHTAGRGDRYWLTCPLFSRRWRSRKSHPKAGGSPAEEENR